MARLDLHSALQAHEANGVRRHSRALVSVPITLRHLARGGIRTARGISLDLSEGGLGALVQGGLAVGDTITIDLLLRDLALSTVAIVRYTSNVRSGFEFLGLTVEERQQLKNVIRTA